MPDLTDNNPESFNPVYARDRAAVVARAIVCIVKSVINDPETLLRIAETLRFEFADLERQVINENRANPES